MNVTEKVIFKGNPEYVEAFYSEVHKKSFYMPANPANGYSVIRLMAAEGQARYASCGTTKELLAAFMDKLIEMCNGQNATPTLKTDVGLIANNIKYRLSYPVDEDASARIGASLTFVDGEDPIGMAAHLTDQKLMLAKGDILKGLPCDDKLYAFFLSLGIEYLGKFIDLESITLDSDYFRNRRTALEGLTLQPPTTK